MLFGVTCPVCGAPGAAPCPACVAELRPAPPLPAPPAVDRCLALLAYEGAGRELVARLKYRNHRAALPGLAAAMATLVDAGDYDVVTWLPTSAERRRARGFDQAELLAGVVARRLSLPCRRLLERRPGPAQTGRTLDQRRRGPVFVARTSAGTNAILVVDDIVTSGATATAGAVAVRAAGATRVDVLAAARTPLKPRSLPSDTERDAS